MFQCTATGIPAPEISWYKNGTDFIDARVTLSEASVSMVAGSAYEVDRTLTLDNATDSDSGIYTCQAVDVNAVQPSVSREFELLVRGKEYSS